jgi:hypothetical protein
MKKVIFKIFATLHLSKKLKIKFKAKEKYLKIHIHSILMNNLDKLDSLILNKKVYHNFMFPHLNSTRNYSASSLTQGH